MSKLFPKDEEWIELPTDPSYLISTRGRLYDTLKKKFVKPSERNLPYIGHHLGWSVRSLTRGGSANRYVSIPSAVLTAFVGNGQVPQYADGDYTNVRLSNLSWGKPGKSLAELGLVG
ncbi:MAG: hypothetical protein WC054_01320 [Candidatus Nanopelagicales bacterium]